MKREGLDFIKLLTWVEKQAEARGWSLAKLARRADFSANTFYMVRNEGRGMGIDTLLGLSDALNIPVEILLRVLGAIPEENVDEEAELGKAYIAKMTPSEKKYALKMLEALVREETAGDGRTHATQDHDTSSPVENKK